MIHVYRAKTKYLDKLQLCVTACHSAKQPAFKINNGQYADTVQWGNYFEGRIRRFVRQIRKYTADS
jgi:hypothetical protein